MATADQIKALLRSHVDGDEERFYGVALQIAADAARQGKENLAKDLRDLADAVRGGASPGRKPASLIQPRGELAGLVSAAYPETKLADMVLSESIQHRLQRILREQRQQSELRSFGLPPRRKILLVGPPGSGKTMSASALAGELHQPLFTVLFDGLLTKFLGESAAKLRLIFDAVARTRGVYFFDEFDAIGGRRGLGNDVGEIRRVLNSFLQFLEQDESPSLVIAATNHAELLDPALHRRFDDVITFEKPDREQSLELIRRRLAVFQTSPIEWGAVADAAKGMSCADLVRAATDAAKESLLAGEPVSTRSLIAALEERRPQGQG